MSLAMRRLLTLAATLVLLSTRGVAAPVARTAENTVSSDGEFSLREFYSIKRALSQSKGGETAAALRAARAATQVVKASAPERLRFYGQDHYEQARDAGGRERWTHVGRPDELTYQLFFRAPLLANGTFIETGAGDGVRASNTLFFEESLGWRGLLVEGSRENFLELFRDDRRKRAVKTYAAVCEESGRMAKFVGDGLAAGAVEDMTRHHVESWGRHFKSLDVYDVPCERMDRMVERAGLGGVVDLWSIDIEGGEWRALNSFDWKRHRVRVVIIEMGRSCFVGKHNRCVSLLRSQGFCRVAKRAVNEFWTSDDGFKAAYCDS